MFARRLPARQFKQYEPEVFVVATGKKLDVRPGEP